MVTIKTVDEIAAEIKYNIVENTDKINDVLSGSVLDVLSTSYAQAIYDLQTNELVLPSKRYPYDS